MRVEEALTNILAQVKVLPAETIPLPGALGRVLAEDVFSGLDVPPFANSAMDGYAVRSEDIHYASGKAPVVLDVVAEIPAGVIPHLELSPGTAARIMTGAPLPPGADTVIRFEETSEGHHSSPHPPGQVSIYRSAPRGENVRRVGEDIRRGQVTLTRGRSLRPQEIGVLAAIGQAKVLVHRRPRVAILATGDELVDIDEPLRPGQIRNSNEYTTAALVQRYGGEPIMLGIARDTVQDLTAKVRQGLQAHVDLFLTSAGVSVGDFDIVKNVLAAEGRMHFWQVDIKPGKPLAFGIIENTPLIGLPGNPVAAVVAFEVFARPAILKLSGRSSLAKPCVSAILEEDVHNSGRRHYMRALIRSAEDGLRVTTRSSSTEVQGSGILSSLVWANSLLIVPEEVSYLPAGSQVEVWLLDGFGENC
jgi:molybdopterin molybdotransferase